MKEFKGKEQHPGVRWMMTLLMALVLATAISGVLYARPMAAKAAASVCGTTPLLLGTNWMGGKGVDVCKNGADYTGKWQCVELIKRLYGPVSSGGKGWITGDWPGNANQMYDNAPKNLKKDLNGSITSINPGDVIVLDKGIPFPIINSKNKITGYTYYGHVVVVDWVDGTTIHTVSQNESQSNPEIDMTWDKSTNKIILAKNSIFTFIGLVHNPASTTILQVRKKTMSDGTNEVFWSNASGVYRSAWKGNSGVGLITLFSGSGIVSFDLQVNHDGQYLLYVATTHDVWEVWWYDPRSPHNGKVVSNGGNMISIQKAIDPTSGKQLLYVMNDKGLDEYSWTPGSTIHGRNIGVLSNPIAMKWATELDGTKMLLAANNSSWKVFRWYGSNAAIVSMAGNMSDITSLDFSLSSDGKHRLYLSTGNGLQEISWYPGGGIGTWQINNTPGIGVQKWQDDSTLQVLYYATTYGVYEYYWKTTDNNSLNSDTIIENKGLVQAFTRSTDPGMQTVYLATDTKVWEAWWGMGTQSVQG